MRLSIAGFRVQKTLLLIALSFPAIACNSADRGGTYTVVLVEDSLPPGVSANPSQFRTQAVTIAGREEGTAHTHARRGRDCSDCNVEVQIVALGDTRRVNPSAAPTSPAPDTGRAVARIRNLDSLRLEDMYGFKPSSQFEYYVWAHTVGAPTQTRMTLLEVPADGQPGGVRAVFRKDLQLCDHDPSPPAYSDADFRLCEGVHTSSASRANYAGMLSLAPLASLFSRVTTLLNVKPSIALPPIWLRCRDGCCG